MEPYDSEKAFLVKGSSRIPITFHRNFDDDRSENKPGPRGKSSVGGVRLVYFKSTRPPACHLYFGCFCSSGPFP